MLIQAGNNTFSSACRFGNTTGHVKHQQHCHIIETWTLLQSQKRTWEITKKPKDVTALAVRPNWDWIWTQLCPFDGWEYQRREQLKPCKFSRDQSNAKAKLSGTDPTCHGWPWLKQPGLICTGSDSSGIAVGTTKGEPRWAAASLSFCEICTSNKRLSKESF